ncbi:MAG: ISNCY family transposase [Acidobacteriota bacterium]|nr:ISNCY family transposase [Acidobacteriota bacterium]
MNKRERHYLEVIHRLARRELTRSSAALELDVSERQVYRLLARYRTAGDAGLVHGHRGRPSNRGRAAETRARVVALYKQREYRDYGPQLFSEVLEERLQLRVSAETVRQWLMSAGLWSGRRAPRRHRKKRERREGIGTLVQFDGSEHDWFEGRGPACCLLVAIDDASSQLFMRFAPSEDTEHVMRTLWQYMERYGIPRTLYTDHGSVYAPRKDGSETLTEVGRALRQLGVELLFANSPQAKGRVERSNRTQQDRLIKALRREGIRTIEEANRYLDERYLAEHNARFACTKDKPDVHRTMFGLALERIFCFEEQRQVRNDYTIQLGGAFLQLERREGASASPLPPPKTMVTVQRWLDGSLHLFWNETELNYRLLEQALEKAPEPKPPQRPPRNHVWRLRPVSPRGAEAQKNFNRSR